MTWTPEDSAAALKQGWDVFAVDGDPNRLEIQRLDEAGVFLNDHAAKVHVFMSATCGDPLCQKALYILASQE